MPLLFVAGVGRLLREENSPPPHSTDLNAAAHKPAVVRSPGDERTLTLFNLHFI